MEVIPKNILKYFRAIPKNAGKGDPTVWCSWSGVMASYSVSLYFCIPEEWPLLYARRVVLEKIQPLVNRIDGCLTSWRYTSGELMVVVECLEQPDASFFVDIEKGEELEIHEDCPSREWLHIVGLSVSRKEQGEA